MIESWVIDRLNPLETENLIILADPGVIGVGSLFEGIIGLREPDQVGTYRPPQHARLAQRNQGVEHVRDALGVGGRRKDGLCALLSRSVIRGVRTSHQERREEPSCRQNQEEAASWSRRVIHLHGEIYPVGIVSQELSNGWGPFG